MFAIISEKNAFNGMFFNDCAAGQSLKCTEKAVRGIDEADRPLKPIGFYQ